VRLARAEERPGGRALLDLTVSNPTACGFRYDAEAVLGPLRNEGALGYDPDPRGMRSAREAVERYYADHRAAVDPDAVVLTTSTSEAYSYLFRLLCDPGDEVLVAQPSYPLFDFLADLDDVRLRPYPLFYDFGWWIDFAELERRIGPKTRAVLVVHPNNPTGHWTHRAERERLEAICARHGLALIVDEVFLDYPLAGEPAAESFAVGPHPALTFVLSGMSKIAALPQMKVAWLAAFGPEELRRVALGRLEVIADTFLSMGTPAQLALPAWLEARGAMQAQIAARTAGNLAALRQADGIELLRVEAGWAAVLLLRGWEAAAGRLLAECGVVVHPGEFYGLADSRMVVVSLLTPLAVFGEALERLAWDGKGINGNQGR
jgi:alanine-synthesizing transaminase